MFWRSLGLLFCSIACVVVAEESPLSVCPDNPRYLQFHGRPTLLITSAEHYGAVLNLDFDYATYLKTLQRDGMNHTRVWLGTYREIPGSFNIQQNTLAPQPNRYICPWARSDQAGYFDGGNKFDLTRWDEQFFLRLHDFMRQASELGIVVELNLFCPNYEEPLWQASPMHLSNNINGVGDCPRDEAYTLKHAALLAVQEAVVRKAVTELTAFDNLYYEVCNEPYFGGVTLEWQHRIVDTIVETERQLGRRHLISMNIANGRAVVERPHPEVSLFNFHYCHPPDVIAMNRDLGKPIGENETGFRGSDDHFYRSEGWDFIIAGGALYNNLDYSFTVSHPDGSLTDFKAPGGGGPTLRRQLRILQEFMQRFKFVRMSPADNLLTTARPPGVTVRILAETGEQYAIYVNGSGLSELGIELPAGPYESTVIDPEDGARMYHGAFNHIGGERLLTFPANQTELAIEIRRSAE